MTSDAPIPESENKTTESSSLLPDWMTAEKVTSVATDAATTAGLAALPGVGIIAATGYAAVKAYDWMTSDSEPSKPADSGTALKDDAGRKILEEVSQKPPQAGESNNSLGNLLTTQPKTEVQQPAQPKDGKESGFVQAMTDAIKTLEIPKLPELSGGEKPPAKLASTPAQMPEGAIIFKPSVPTADGKEQVVVPAVVEKPGVAGGGGSPASEIRIQAVKPNEPNGYSDVVAAQPVKVEAPVQPVKVDPPAQTVKIEAPAQPVKVESPAEPVKVEPPAQPAKVEPPAQPVKVETPAEPIKVEPPAQPAEVEPPAQPARVDPPAQPVKVEVPAQPVKLEVPAQPVKVDNAVQASAPESPSAPPKSGSPAAITPEIAAPVVKVADPILQPTGGVNAGQPPAGGDVPKLNVTPQVTTLTDSNVDPGSPVRSISIIRAQNSGAPVVDTTNNAQGAISMRPGEQGSPTGDNGVGTIAGRAKPGEPVAVDLGGKPIIAEVRSAGTSIPAKPGEVVSVTELAPNGPNKSSPAVPPGAPAQPGNPVVSSPGAPAQSGNPIVSSPSAPRELSPGMSRNDSVGNATVDGLAKSTASGTPTAMPPVGGQPGHEGRERCRDRMSAGTFGELAGKTALSPENGGIANDQGRGLSVRSREHERNVSTNGESGTVQKAGSAVAQTGAMADNPQRPGNSSKEAPTGINSPGNGPNTVNPPSPGRTQADVPTADQAGNAGRMVGSAGATAIGTTGDAGRHCTGQRPDGLARNSVPEGSVPTRLPDGITKPATTDATGSTSGSNAGAAIDRTQKGQPPTDTTGGVDRTGAKLPGSGIQDRPLDTTMPGVPRTSLETGRPSTELARAASGDIQVGTTRLTDPALKGQEITRLNQAIDRILATQPELKNAPKDVVLREILKQLGLEGMLPASTSAMAPKALEVIKILLEQKLNSPQTQPSSQGGAAAQDPSQSIRVAPQADGQVPGKNLPLSQIADAAGLPLRPQPAAQNQAAPSAPAHRGSDGAVAGQPANRAADGAAAGQHGSRGAEGPAGAQHAGRGVDGPTAGQHASRGADGPTAGQHGTRAADGPSTVHHLEGSKGSHGNAPAKPGEFGGREGLRQTGEAPTGKAETGFANGRAHEPLTSKGDAGNHSNSSHTRFEGDKGRVDGSRDPLGADRTQGIRHNADDQSVGGRRHVGQQVDQAGHKPTGADRDPLSTDKHGIDRRETTDKEGDAKPHIRKGDHDGTRSGDGWIGAAVAALGGVAKSDDKQDNTDRKQPQADVRKQDRRTRYFVKFGDTLESIAEKALGDKRFAELLITINRSLLSFKFVGITRVPDLREGQMIWLPTADETAYHRRTFFGNSGTTAGATTVPQTFSPVSPATASGNNSRPQEAELIFVPPVLEIVDDSLGSDRYQSPAATPMGLILHRIRFAGNKQSQPISAMHRADLGYISRRTYTVRLGDTIRSIALRDPLMGDAGLWTLIARINNLDTTVDPSGAPIVRLRRGQAIQLPNPNEIDQHKLLGKFAGIASPVFGGNTSPVELSSSGQRVAQPPQAQSPAPPPVQPIEVTPVAQPTKEVASPRPARPSAEIEARMFIDRLALNCRVVSAESPSETYVWGIKLQADIAGRWTTIASYECGQNWAARYLFHPDGRREHLDLDLPVSVVQEMAREDFLRNFESYARNYGQEGTQNQRRHA